MNRHVARLREMFFEDGLAHEYTEELDAIEEQLEAAQPLDRSTWREGMVTVYDYDGNYVGCMGRESWDWLLEQGYEKVRGRFEQLEAAQSENRLLREEVRLHEESQIPKVPRAAAERMARVEEQLETLRSALLSLNISQMDDADAATVRAALSNPASADRNRPSTGDRVKAPLVDPPSVWVCPHGATFSGPPDFISGARNAHDAHGDSSPASESSDMYVSRTYDATRGVGGESNVRRQSDARPEEDHAKGLPSETSSPATNPCSQCAGAPSEIQADCLRCGGTGVEPDPASDPLGYIELDEHDMCPHDYAKGLGCHVCDPASEPKESA